MQLKLMQNSLRGAWRMTVLRAPELRREHSPRRQTAPADPAELTRVVRVSASPTERESVLRSRLRAGLDQLRLADELHAPGKRWLLMGNFNSADPYPASSDLTFVEAAARLFQDAGASITLGAGAGIPWLPTAKVIHELGVDAMAQRLNLDLWVTEESNTWVKVATPLDGWSIVVPERFFEFDVIVYLPVIRTHRFAGFSQGMKLGMGIIHPASRRGMHIAKLEEKIAAMAAVLQPDFIIADGRRAFITGGPEAGLTVDPGVLLMGSDLLTLEVQGMRELERAGKEAGADIDVSPYQERIVRAGIRLGVSDYGTDAFEVVGVDEVRL